MHPTPSPLNAVKQWLRNRIKTLESFFKDLALQALHPTPVTALFFILIGSAVFIRLFQLHYPILDHTQAEPLRDYLIARHAALGWEIPLAGPWNGALAGFFNSPIYYWLLAPCLWLWDSPLMLVLVNIASQIAAGISLYYVVKQLTDKWAGLFAASLFLFYLPNITEYSQSVWQPYFMLSMAVFAYTSGARALFTNKRTPLIWSLVLTLLAGAVHNSFFLLFPIWYTVYAWKLKQFSTRDRVIVLGLVTSMLLVLYGPLLLGLVVHPHRSNFAAGFSNPTEHGLQDTFLQLARQISSSTKQLLGLGNTRFSYIFQIILTTLLTAYGVYKSARVQRKVLGIIALAFLLFIIAASFLQNVWSYYFLPLLPLEIIFLTLLMSALIAQSARWIFCMLSILLATHATLFCLSQPALVKASIEQKNNILQSVIENIEGQKTQRGLKDYYFFDVAVFGYDNDTFTSEHTAYLWAPLEKKLGMQLTSITTATPSGYTRISTSAPVVWYIVCRGQDSARKNCLEPFAQQHPNYSYITSVYDTTPITVFAASLN